MKAKYIILSAVATLIIIAGGVFLLSNRNSSLPDPTNYEYYWGNTCPHCENVQKFMDSWSDKDKITIDKYEVYDSPKNRVRFIERGEYCDFPRKELGVPFLVTPDGICLSGDQPIIDHFKNLTFE